MEEDASIDGSGNGVRYAGFWIRFVAEVLDSLVLTLVSWVVQLLLIGIYSWVMRLGGAEWVSPFSGPSGAFFLQVFNALLYLLIAAIYYTLAHFKYGTTLGKRPLGVYVVNFSDSGLITMRQSVVRTIGYGVSYVPFLIGYLMAAFHPEKRALHDLIAGTASVRLKKPLPRR